MNQIKRIEFEIDRWEVAKKAAPQETRRRHCDGVLWGLRKCLEIASEYSIADAGSHGRHLDGDELLGWIQSEARRLNGKGITGKFKRGFRAGAINQINIVFSAVNAALEAQDDD